MHLVKNLLVKILEGFLESATSNSPLSNFIHPDSSPSPAPRVKSFTTKYISEEFMEKQLVPLGLLNSRGKHHFQLAKIVCPVQPPELSVNITSADILNPEESSQIFSESIV